MNLIEVAHPVGALTPRDQADLAHDIVTGISGPSENVPESTLRRARAMTHVGFKELTGWVTGDLPWTPGATAPVWVTFTVPEAWREEMSRCVIGVARRAVRRLDRARGWDRPFGSLWINLVGVADGSIGLDGKQADADDVVATMTEEFRATLANGEIPVSEGALLDPMCGMLVKDVRGAIVVEHEGERIGFCAESCRDAWLRLNASAG